MAKQQLPLFKHRNGQWAKKILGKIYYFGTDYDAALDSFLEQRDHLYAGRGKPEKSTEPTLVELANLYYDGCRQRVSSGALSQSTLDKAEAIIRRLIDFRGPQDHPGHWTPLDFRDIKLWLHEPVKRTSAIRGGIKQPKTVRTRAAGTVDSEIRRIKAFLGWCHAARLIPPPDFGKEFSQSPQRQQRLARAQFGKRTFEAAELRLIIAKSRPAFLPILLLGINGGMGARDIAQLTLEQFDGSEWLDCPRQKTGMPRRIWLWPETRAAIKEYLSKRKRPYSRQYDEIAFLTAHRQPWIRGTQDAASQAFKSAREAAGLDSGTFYDLRRTFQSIGDETLDFPVVKYCMGHVPAVNDMSAKYREVSDERIKKVCQHVRQWLQLNKRKGRKTVKG